MTFKTITRRGRDWLWPEYDVKLLEAFDDVDNIDTILEYCPNRRVAIQAGGACGVWPWRLAQEFKWVHTFEPDSLNFHCLSENIVGQENIRASLAALGNTEGLVFVNRHDSEKANCGAGFVVPIQESIGRLGIHRDTKPIKAWDIDRILGGPEIDLICLDVEGFEGFALWGGMKCIHTSWPTIVIEEKPLPQGGDHLCARRLLESWSYVERAKVGNDAIFTHG